MVYLKVRVMLQIEGRNKMLRFLFRALHLLELTMRNIFKYTLASTALALLAACGGGSDDDDETTPVTSSVSAEGVWEGRTAAGTDLSILVLENNEIWTLFGVRTASSLTVLGFNKGAGTQSGSTYSGSGVEFLANGATTRGTFSATVVPGVSLNGTVTGAQPVSFSSTPLRSAYNYNSPAQVSTIVGSWRGQTLGGVVTQVAILANGSVVGSSGGCEFSGSITPRASGKNVFDVTLRFAGSPCVQPGQTVAGIGLASALPNGQTQLLVAGTNSANTAGTVFFAQR